MSYNITTFKVKKIENFKIEIDLLHKDEDFKPTMVIDTDQKTTIHIDDTVLTGVVDNGWLDVGAIACYGESSGTIWEQILLPTFESSTGFFEVSLVWEGGEEIELVTVKNGEVIKIKIEL